MADDDEQLELLPSAAPRRRAPRPSPEPAEALPVARVVVDSSLAHLDRPFDYLVPSTLDAETVPGCRVRVRFAGRLTDAIVVERVEGSDHEGALAYVSKVVSSEPVLSPIVLGLCRAVADRWAGTLSDVLRLALPPRHARAEAQPSHPPDHQPPGLTDDAWQAWPDGPAFVAALAAGERPRACWAALPTHDPAEAVAEAVLATLRSGRGSIVCVADVRDVARWDAVFTRVLGEGRHQVLTGAQKPAERYRSFLAVSRGAAHVVLGTRGAAFAPVHDLGLVAMFDDGDDLFAEPRAPYPHTREVLLTRANREGAAVLIGGHARSVEAQALVESGWCADLVAEPVTRRRLWPTVDATDGAVDGGAPARLPHSVFRAIRDTDGPVLVQVPRRGYRPALACQTCREPARCVPCSGPLGQRGAGQPIACRWCGTRPDTWSCSVCGGTDIRAPGIGHLRTAEEYARAFPEHDVITSGGESVLGGVDDGRVIVLATPGAEPPTPRGYALVVLMDTWLMLARDDVRVVEESHRRWFNALALARETAPAVAVGDPAALQALVRADPIGVAARELVVRAETHLPPIGRLATVDGPVDAVGPLVERSWTPHTEVLGPVELAEDDRPDHQRLVLRAPRREGAALATALQVVQAERSAAKLPPVRVRVDPVAF